MLRPVTNELNQFVIVLLLGALSIGLYYVGRDDGIRDACRATCKDLDFTRSLVTDDGVCDCITPK